MVKSVPLTMTSDELSGEAKRRYTDLLRTLVQIDVNKQQTKSVYIHFPTPEENREAAAERGMQGTRVEDMADVLGRLGFDADPEIVKGTLTFEGTELRPAMFRAPIGDWDDFLVFRYLRDRARACWALGYLGTHFVPCAVVVARLFHHAALFTSRPVVYARWTDHQLKRLAEPRDKAAQQAIQASIEKWFPLARALLETPADEAAELACGVRSRRAAVCERLFVREVAKELGALGYTIPDSLKRFGDMQLEPIYLNAADNPPTRYREKIVKLLKMHLASEYTTAYLEALDPPTPAEFAEWSQTIKEEGEHGEGMVDILRDLGEDANAVIDDMRYGDGKYLLDFFKVEIESWDEVGIMRWLSERAAGYQSLAALGSNYIPFAAWSARNYMDEGMAHAGIGRQIALRGIREGRKTEIQRLVYKRYPHVLDYFGGEGAKNEFLDLGIKTRPNAELRRRWMRDQERDCSEAGLKMPDDPLQGARQHY